MLDSRNLALSAALIQGRLAGYPAALKAALRGLEFF